MWKNVPNTRGSRAETTTAKCLWFCWRDDKFTMTSRAQLGTSSISLDWNAYVSGVCGTCVLNASERHHCYLVRNQMNSGRAKAIERIIVYTHGILHYFNIAVRCRIFYSICQVEINTRVYINAYMYIGISSVYISNLLQYCTILIRGGGYLCACDTESALQSHRQFRCGIYNEFY